MPNSNKYAVVKFGEVSGSSPNRIVAQPSGDLNFYTASDFVFWNNNVGIGDNNPTERLVVDGNIKISNSESGIILQSHDGQCWKVTVDNTGTLITEAEDCNNPTSIKEPEPESVINIYPNPAKSVVIVEISGEITDPIVQVYSLNGALVLTKKMIRKSTKVNISKLAPGEYIFRLVSNSGVVIKSEKILKY
jgi:hypothetical protein